MKTQFVAMPLLFGMLSNSIKYTDILTYFTLKVLASETDRNQTFTEQQIASRMNVSAKSVHKSLLRLKNDNMINVNGTLSESFTFTFADNNKTFMMIPVAVIDSDLSKQERSLLIALKMACLENPVDIIPSLKVICDLLNTSAKELLEVFMTLLAKKYVTEVKSKNPKLPYFFQLTNSINWITADNDSIYKCYSEQTFAA